MQCACRGHMEQPSVLVSVGVVLRADVEHDDIVKLETFYRFDVCDVYTSCERERLVVYQAHVRDFAMEKCTVDLLRTLTIWREECDTSGGFLTVEVAQHVRKKGD